LGAARIERAEGGYRVVGELSFATVPELQGESAALLVGSGDIEIDLSGVQRSDSAGLALVLEWMREAQGRGSALKLRNLPEQMRALARLSGLEGLLPVEPG
jgi:phospholipid transport system transporter-binding protein